jgi:hypothetical protein
VLDSHLVYRHQFANDFDLRLHDPKLSKHQLDLGNGVVQRGCDVSSALDDRDGNGDRGKDLGRRADGLGRRNHFVHLTQVGEPPAKFFRQLLCIRSLWKLGMQGHFCHRCHEEGFLSSAVLVLPRTDNKKGAQKKTLRVCMSARER